MKTKKEMTAYAYSVKCGVTPAAIYNRIARGRLILNESGLVPSGTLIVEKLKLGRPLICFR